MDVDGPSLSTFMAVDGLPSHMREFGVHRSPYQSKEADHTLGASLDSRDARRLRWSYPVR